MEMAPSQVSIISSVSSLLGDMIAEAETLTDE
jgi:hypothetical protein